MEMNSKEMQVIERTAADQKDSAVTELQELQLSIVGGGNAFPDFG